MWGELDMIRGLLNLRSSIIWTWIKKSSCMTIFFAWCSSELLLVLVESAFWICPLVLAIFLFTLHPIKVIYCIYTLAVCVYSLSRLAPGFICKTLRSNSSAKMKWIFHGKKLIQTKQGRCDELYKDVILINTILSQKRLCVFVILLNQEQLIPVQHRFSRFFITTNLWETHQLYKEDFLQMKDLCLKWGENTRVCN